MSEKTASEAKAQVIEVINNIKFENFRYFDFSIKLRHAKIAPGMESTGEDIALNGYING